MLGMGRLQIPEPCVLYSDWLDCFREVFPCSYQPFGTARLQGLAGVMVYLLSGIFGFPTVSNSVVLFL